MGSHGSEGSCHAGSGSSAGRQGAEQTRGHRRFTGEAGVSGLGPGAQAVACHTSTPRSLPRATSCSALVLAYGRASSPIIAMTTCGPMPAPGFQFGSQDAMFRRRFEFNVFTRVCMCILHRCYSTYLARYMYPDLCSIHSMQRRIEGPGKSVPLFRSKKWLFYPI